MGEILAMQSVASLKKQAAACYARAIEAGEATIKWQLRTGAALIDLKAKVGHGNFGSALEELGIPQRTAREWMEEAGKPGAAEKNQQRKNKSYKPKAKPNRRLSAEMPDDDNDVTHTDSRFLDKFGKPYDPSWSCDYNPDDDIEGEPISVSRTRGVMYRLKEAEIYLRTSLQDVSRSDDPATMSAEMCQRAFDAIETGAKLTEWIRQNSPKIFKACQRRIPASTRVFGENKGPIRSAGLAAKENQK